MNEASVEFIIARIIENAKDSYEEANTNKGYDFYEGKKLAYYEILDTIKSELTARDQNLKDFGLDVDLEKEFI